MRKKIVAGNWKMNLSLEEARALVAELKVKIDQHNDSLRAQEEGLPEVVIFPPFPYLTRIAEVFSHYEGVSVGAQNCHYEEQGAFTGEVSAFMLQSVGASHVIIGHSERRSQFEEDDKLLAEKTRQALKNGLTPVFCCGEVLSDRENDNHFKVVADQLLNGLFWMDEKQLQKAVIAYEPVWAIGTGKTATPEQAQQMHAYIRKLVADTYNPDVASEMTILYGGSCNAKNAADLFSNQDVDGGLIGGASLKPDDFFSIIMALQTH